jgi:hypothetical protein
MVWKAATHRGGLTLVGVTETDSAAASNSRVQPMVVSDEQGSFLMHGTKERSMMLGRIRKC